jgi:hypothetical protein
MNEFLRGAESVMAHRLTCMKMKLRPKKKPAPNPHLRRKEPSKPKSQNVYYRTRMIQRGAKEFTSLIARWRSQVFIQPRFHVSKSDPYHGFQIPSSGYIPQNSVNGTNARSGRDAIRMITGSGYQDTAPSKHERRTSKPAMQLYPLAPVPDGLEKASPQPPPVSLGRRLVCA